MGAHHLALAIGLAAQLCACAALAGDPAGARLKNDLDGLKLQAQQLYEAGKYAKALPIARRYADAVKVRQGADHPEYAAALSQWAALLQATNQPGEAEPVMRRALAIDEKSLGPDHPDVALILSDLAHLLQTTNRMAEAEPLRRRALAITEKSLGPDHPNVAVDLRNLAQLLKATNRLGEAEPLLRRALVIDEKSFGPDHPNFAMDLGSLAAVLQDTNRLHEAELLMRRALAIDEKSLGPDHLNVATRLDSLATLLQAANQLAEAEPLLRRALAIDEKAFGPDHPNVSIEARNLGQLLQATNRPTEAEPLLRRALAIDEKTFGSDRPNVAPALNELVDLLLATNRLDEAEPLMRRAIAIEEKSLGRDHPTLGIHLNRLANLLETTDRFREAEPLMRRVLIIDERSLGPNHPGVAKDLNNLGQLLISTARASEAEPLLRRALAIEEAAQGDEPFKAVLLGNLSALLRATNRMAEAEPLARRALALDATSIGPENHKIAQDLNNLAQLLQATNRFAEAEPMYRRALAIDEACFGPVHPDVARDLNDLADLLAAGGRSAEAEPLMRRALAIDESNFGADHPKVAIDLNKLASLLEEREDWQQSVILRARAKPIMIARNDGDRGDWARVAKTALAGKTWNLRAHARALHHTAADSPAAREEGFELAQWALQVGAGDLLAPVSARFAKGAGELARLVRQRQDYLKSRQSEVRQLEAAAGRADAKMLEDTRVAVAGLDQHLDAIDARLAAEFRGYVELSNPRPLSIIDVQALLKPDEALLVFLHVAQMGRLAEETLVWLVTKEDARWSSITFGTRSLSDRVAALRCGLDASSWNDPMRWDERPDWPQETALDQERAHQQNARRQRCRRLLGVDVSADDLLPFNPTRAYELYQSLLAPFAEQTKGKRLLIVPSGALTSLPFHVLVTEKPDPTLVGIEAYRQAAWLALHQSVSVLPAVGSLQELGNLASSRAAKPFIGFGNPLLLGPSGKDKRAWDSQHCMQQPAPKGVAEDKGRQRGGVALGAIDPAQLRMQRPLPETADELCAMADALGVMAQQTDTVWLGKRANVHNLKTLSREGKLAHYKVVHFATHGLLAGDSQAILAAKVEPALLLTPQGDAPSSAQAEDDDGLLPASAVAQLQLDADWVVLSACNTQPGDMGDAEALSGLARAFFYARARGLLVSHWSVTSDAAVKLTTRAIAELKADPSIGHAEALRRAMQEMISNGPPSEAHPANWAAFVLVGEGGGQKIAAAATPAVSPRPARLKKPLKTPDWRVDVWR
jgi:CHAT domain-containing protein/tetratricopeptide (TPR) repeat protein